MLRGNQEAAMASEWITLTKTDGEPIDVNLTNISSFEKDRYGTKIWFLAGVKDGTEVVTQGMAEIRELIAKAKNTHRT
jgi:ribonucleotide monophosphatase NagD (HAD superfamily)